MWIYTLDRVISDILIPGIFVFQQDLMMPKPLYKIVYIERHNKRKRYDIFTAILAYFPLFFRLLGDFIYAQKLNNNIHILLYYLNAFLVLLHEN